VRLCLVGQINIHSLQGKSFLSILSLPMLQTRTIVPGLPGKESLDSAGQSTGEQPDVFICLKAIESATENNRLRVRVKM